MKQTLICPQCGKKYEEGKFCGECGSKLVPVQSKDEKTGLKIFFKDCDKTPFGDEMCRISTVTAMTMNPGDEDSMIVVDSADDADYIVTEENYQDFIDEYCNGFRALTSAERQQLCDRIDSMDIADKSVVNVCYYDTELGVKIDDRPVLVMNMEDMEEEEIDELDAEYNTMYMCSDKEDLKNLILPGDDRDYFRILDVISVESMAGEEGVHKVCIELLQHTGLMYTVIENCNVERVLNSDGTVNEDAATRVFKGKGIFLGGPFDREQGVNFAISVDKEYLDEYSEDEYLDVENIPAYFETKDIVINNAPWLVKTGNAYKEVMGVEFTIQEEFDINKLKVVTTRYFLTQNDKEPVLVTDRFYYNDIECKPNDLLYSSDESFSEKYSIIGYKDSTSQTTSQQPTTPPSVSTTSSSFGLDSLNERMATMQSDLDRQMREMQEKLDQMFKK